MIGELIVARRRLRGMSQSQLAEATGLNQTYISRVERGEVELPQRTNLEKFGAALGISLPEFYRAAGVLEEAEPAPRPHDGPAALSTAEMIAFVEANPSQAFRERLARMRGLLRTDAYERLVVKTYLAWLANGDLGLSAAEAVLGPGH